MRHYRISAMISLSLLIISGCGQRGPLYLPQDEPEPSEPSSQIGSQATDQPMSFSYNMSNLVSIPAVAAIREGA